MNDGYVVDADQIRAHAADLDAFAGRFDAVRAASAHIARDDAAYGMLCGWISGLLEARHARQDELIAYVAENITLAAAGLRRTADSYDAVEAGAADLLRRAGSGLGG